MRIADKLRLRSGEVNINTIIDNIVTACDEAAQAGLNKVTYEINNLESNAGVRAFLKAWAYKEGFVAITFFGSSVTLKW